MKDRASPRRLLITIIFWLKYTLYRRDGDAVIAISPPGGGRSANGGFFIFQF